MPATDIPRRRADRDGRRSAGRAFLHHEAEPARGDNPNGRATSSRPTRPAAVGWNELATSDPVAARRFYGDQFGWGERRVHGYGRDGRIPLHRDTTADASARCSTQADGQPPHWRFYFRVPSIDAAKETAEQKGGTIHHGPKEVPERRLGRHRHRPAGRGVRARRRRSKLKEECMSQQAGHLPVVRQRRGRKAAEFYASVFPDSHVGPAHDRR